MGLSSQEMPYKFTCTFVRFSSSLTEGFGQALRGSDFHSKHSDWYLGCALLPHQLIFLFSFYNSANYCTVHHFIIHWPCFHISRYTECLAEYKVIPINIVFMGLVLSNTNNKNHLYKMKRDIGMADNETRVPYSIPLSLTLHGLAIT